MTQDASATPCPASVIAELVETVRRDPEQGLVRVEALVPGYPTDARLRFLQGSLLAGLRRYGEAHEAMARAVAIAPGFHVARFQLGFLELTSGDTMAAVATWGPLLTLPEDEPLRIFVSGLQHLIRDEFEPAIDALKRGITLNQTNPPINTDMQLLIDKAREVMEANRSKDEPVSATHLLLQQYTSSKAKH